MNERLGAAFRQLSVRGFFATRRRAGQRRFEGVLPCLKGGVRVQLTVSDWDFLSYPEILLLERPSFLPELMPHVDVSGGLCYFAPGSVVLDRYDPATAVAQCLDQATALLDRIASDPNYRSSDIQDEFQAHWEFGQLTQPWPVLLGRIEPGAVSASYSIIEVAGRRKVMVASDSTDVITLAQSLGTSEPSRKRFQCWLFKTAVRPSVPLFMPKTVKQLFEWLRQWDRAVYNGVQRVLGHESAYLNYTFVTFAVDTPVGWVGFGFDLDQVTRLGSKRRPTLYRQYLHGRGGSGRLLRLSITDISGDYVHNRNLSFPDLRDKRIAVIGCGAIGSFLAQSLVRLGAGTGRGTLTLMDPDTLQPENLGRHLLGYPSLFQFKANAVAAELSRLFPWSRVVPIAKSAFALPDLFAAELIIDATGEEAVSERLNGIWVDWRRPVPVLYAWIRGNGESVQGLWTDSPDGGCYRCLKVTDPLHYRQDRFPVLTKPPERRFLGCQAFTPYAVSAPMQAAALATDMISAWMNGNPSPRFRTRSVENADVRAVKNQNISRLKGCPACGQP